MSVSIISFSSYSKSSKGLSMIYFSLLINITSMSYYDDSTISMVIGRLLFISLLNPTRLKSSLILAPTFHISKSSDGAIFDKKGIQSLWHSQCILRQKSGIFFSLAIVLALSRSHLNFLRQFIKSKIKTSSREFCWKIASSRILHPRQSFNFGLAL